MKLTFRQLTDANKDRADRTKAPIEKLDPTFFAVELAGETGELCNVIKKIERLRILGDLHPWTLGQSRKGLQEQLKREIGDVAIVLDLLCQAFDETLEDCVTVAFNEKSAKIEKLGAQYLGGQTLPRLIGACRTCGGEVSIVDKLCMSCGTCHCNECLEPANSI